MVDLAGAGDVSLFADLQTRVILPANDKRWTSFSPPLPIASKCTPFEVPQPIHLIGAPARVPIPG
jgi:hypothetical protein